MPAALCLLVHVSGPHGTHHDLLGQEELVACPASGALWRGGGPGAQELQSPRGLCTETWVRSCLVHGSSEVPQRSGALLNLPPPPPPNWPG